MGQGHKMAQRCGISSSKIVNISCCRRRTKTSRVSSNIRKSLPGLQTLAALPQSQECRKEAYENNHKDYKSCTSNETQIFTFDGILLQNQI
jgi:hypothetical protein